MQNFLELRRFSKSSNTPTALRVPGYNCRNTLNYEMLIFRCLIKMQGNKKTLNQIAPRPRHPARSAVKQSRSIKPKEPILETVGRELRPATRKLQIQWNLKVINFLKSYNPSNLVSYLNRFGSICSAQISWSKAGASTENQSSSHEKFVHVEYSTSDSANAAISSLKKLGIGVKFAPTYPIFTSPQTY